MPVTEAITDQAWLQGDFITVGFIHVHKRTYTLQTVQNRGAAVIKARKLSSAVSAAKAITDHVRTWFQGTAEVCGCGGWQ